MTALLFVSAYVRTPPSAVAYATTDRLYGSLKAESSDTECKDKYS